MTMGSTAACLAAHVVLPLSVLSASPVAFPDLWATAPHSVEA
jgi:hypothetical protein